MAKSQIVGITDKLSKIGDSFTINVYDNGYMLEASGRDHEDNWKTAKILCNTQDQLVALVSEAINMTRDE
jgi:hypothetical protein